MHLTFGADPATSMTISWLTSAAVGRPMIRYTPEPPNLPNPDASDPDASDPDASDPPVDIRRPGCPSSAVAAVSRTYQDARSGRRVFAHHATLRGLRPGTAYRYTVEHDGQPAAEPATLRTAPAARAAFTFTFFGDHGTDHPADPNGSPASGHAVAAVERAAPLVAFLGGDLSYANDRPDPAQAWSDWFEMISRSARSRPWMPCVGNHEIEPGNGAHGLAAYQTYFELPPNGAESHLAGLWYALTLGGVRFVVLAADDVCYQHGPIYLRGFSAGRQTDWLERTLAQARADPAIDWIVVIMHQTAISTSASHHGADLGIREAWLPLFDRYGVDLVLHGHEHHYERSHPVRGSVPASPTLTPQPAVARPGPAGPIDAAAGRVHLLVGTGGAATPSAGDLSDPPAGRVIVGLRDPEPGRRRRGAARLPEDAGWLAFRGLDQSYAIARCEVDPGEPGGTTSLRVTVLDTGSPGPAPAPIDEVVLVRSRADAGPSPAPPALPRPAGEVAPIRLS